MQVNEWLSLSWSLYPQLAMRKSENISFFVNLSDRESEMLMFFNNLYSLYQFLFPYAKHVLLKCVSAMTYSKPKWMNWLLTFQTCVIYTFIYKL